MTKESFQAMYMSNERCTVWREIGPASRVSWVAQVVPDALEYHEPGFNAAELQGSSQVQSINKLRAPHLISWCLEKSLNFARCQSTWDL